MAKNKRDKTKFKILMFTFISLAIILSFQFVVAQSAVDLGTAGDFAILSKSGITNVPTSSIIGDVGTIPISGTAIGLTCPEVTGTIYSVDNAGPLPCRVINAALLDTARIDMEAAYTDAAGRTGGSPIGGNIGGMTLGPGVYTTTSNLIIPTDVILSGNSTDVWIFQVGGTLDISSGKKVILSGGAQASNVFWQVSGVTTLGTYSIFNGNILGKTKIAMQTGSSLCGRTLAQTEVTLDHNYISTICGNNINETNTNNLTRLTVNKIVINDNGGTKNVSDFILLINDYAVLSGIPNVVAPGTYTVSELTDPGYSATFSGDCSANGTVLLNVGDVKNCTITNNDIHFKSIPVMDSKLLIVLVLFTLILGLYGLKKYGR